MDKQDYTALKQALELSIDSSASVLALHKSLLKLGVIIDDDFFKQEKERLKNELRDAVYSEINKQ